MARAKPTDTLNIRGIESTAAERIRRGAATRGLTLGAYLAALVQFHDAMRFQADHGDKKIAAELAAHGLETVAR